MTSDFMTTVVSVVQYFCVISIAILTVSTIVALITDEDSLTNTAAKAVFAFVVVTTLVVAVIVAVMSIAYVVAAVNAPLVVAFVVTVAVMAIAFSTVAYLERH